MSESPYCRSTSGSALKEYFAHACCHQKCKLCGLFASSTSTSITCLCCISIPVNLLPLRSEFLWSLSFIVVPATPSAQGIAANWHHIEFQDLWDGFSQTEREPFLNTPPQTYRLLYPPPHTIAAGTLVTLLQTVFRREIAHVWDTSAFYKRLHSVVCMNKPTVNV